MSYDLVIRNAAICDGTGAQPYRSSVAIAGGKIVEIDPKLANAHNNLGFVLYHKGQLDESIT